MVLVTVVLVAVRACPPLLVLVFSMIPVAGTVAVGAVFEFSKTTLEITVGVGVRTPFPSSSFAGMPRLSVGFSGRVLLARE